MTKNISGNIRYLAFDKAFFNHRKEQFVDLYLDAFSKGEYAQSIIRNDAESDLSRLIETGIAYAAWLKNQIVGFAIAVNLSEDKLFPYQNQREIILEKTLYIAEVLVNENFRGLQIATELIKRLESNLFEASVIRVWDENLPAVKLYNKLGYQTIDFIHQSKVDLEGNSFNMKKLYMYKKL